MTKLQQHAVTAILVAVVAAWAWWVISSPENTDGQTALQSIYQSRSK